MVIRAVQMAVWQRQGTEPLILHSDRGSQFRSGDYQRYPAANGLVCSMSAVGHCGDNAACEGFFGLLKRERVYHTTYPILNAVRADVFEYIERFHNPRIQRRKWWRTAASPWPRTNSQPVGHCHQMNWAATPSELDTAASQLDT